VWMQRIWLYYKEKFDQRDDPLLAPLLQAAEELVWSCYSQVFTNRLYLPDGLVRGPAPLAFIDAQYSPATWEASKLAPSELREGSDVEGLDGFLKTLPVPVLRLPPWCVESPWWLIFVAHEVGHNIQRELTLVDRFGSLLEQVCLNQGRPQRPDAERWKRWGAEIFADLFSVMMIGQPAVASLRELIFGPEAEMNALQSDYPAPLVRLALMAGAADRLGFDGTSAIAGLDPHTLSTSSRMVQEDLKLVAPILEAALGPLSERVPSLETLSGLQEIRDSRDKSVRYWGNMLLKTPPAPQRSPQQPRYIAAGAWAAWETATSMAGEAERQSALNVLVTNTISTLRSSGPEGTRARLYTGNALDDFGADLAHQLLRTSRQTRPQGSPT